MKKLMIITLAVRVQKWTSAECDLPLWGTLSTSPSDRPAELEFPVMKEKCILTTLTYIHNIV